MTARSAPARITPSRPARFFQRLLLAVAAFSLLGLVGCQTPNPVLRQQAKNALNHGDVALAAKRLAQAVDQKPIDWRAWYLTGQTRLRQGLPLQAQVAFEKALTLRPDHVQTPEIIDGLAESLYRQEATVELHNLLDEATQERQDTHAFLRQATYLGRIGDIDGATLAYRKAARFAEGDNVDPYLAMAGFFETIGDRTQAITALRYAYGVNDDDMRVHQRLRDLGVIPGPTIALPAE